MNKRLADLQVSFHFNLRNFNQPAPSQEEQDYLVEQLSMRWVFSWGVPWQNLSTGTTAYINSPSSHYSPWSFSFRHLAQAGLLQPGTGPGALQGEGTAVLFLEKVNKFRDILWAYKSIKGDPGRVKRFYFLALEHCTAGHPLLHIPKYAYIYSPILGVIGGQMFIRG